LCLFVIGSHALYELGDSEMLLGLALPYSSTVELLLLYVLHGGVFQHFILVAFLGNCKVYHAPVLATTLAIIVASTLVVIAPPAH